VGERDQLLAFAALLDNAANQLNKPTEAEGYVPGVIVTLKTILKSWKEGILAPPAGTDQELRLALLSDRNQVEGVLNAISPPAPEEATFTLYEIDNSAGVTTLREVKL
jgi:hypothetical protein